MHIPSYDDPMTRKEMAAALAQLGVEPLDVLVALQGCSTGLWDDPIEGWMLVEVAERLNGTRKEQVDAQDS